MTRPRILVLSGYGINCEQETQFAFEQAEGRAEIVHINDLPGKNILDYQILALPGGFSFGDDTGSGKAFAHRLRATLQDKLQEFVTRDRLIIGICNGFQILTQLGLVPALDGNYDQPTVALTHNTQARYHTRWVDLAINPLNPSPWLQLLGTISLPIAHGEGKFYAPREVLERLWTEELVAANYTEGELCKALDLPANPNGSLDNIAAITSTNGRVLGMMPHPERAIHITQHPLWTQDKEIYRRNKKYFQPTEGEGLQLFRNGVRHFT